MPIKQSNWLINQSINSWIMWLSPLTCLCYAERPGSAMRPPSGRPASGRASSGRPGSQRPVSAQNNDQQMPADNGQYDEYFIYCLHHYHLSGYNYKIYWFNRKKYLSTKQFISQPMTNSSGHICEYNCFDTSIFSPIVICHSHFLR